jgi:hypothetical protein
MGTAGSGIQPVVARDNGWPVDDVPALKSDADAGVLSRRAAARNGRDDGARIPPSFAEGLKHMVPSPNGLLGRLTALTAVDPQNPERLAPPPRLERRQYV